MLAAVADVVLTQLEERTMSGSELLRQVAQRRTETAASDLQRRAVAAASLPGPHSTAVVCVARDRTLHLTLTLNTHLTLTPSLSVCGVCGLTQGTGERVRRLRHGYAAASGRLPCHLRRPR